MALQQGEVEALLRVEVAVEGGRDDARLARDLAQAEAAEALALEQAQRRVEQRDARALLLLSVVSPVRPGLYLDFTGLGCLRIHYNHDLQQSDEVKVRQ